jgi:hypothetical protein
MQERDSTGHNSWLIPNIRTRTVGAGSGGLRSVEERKLEQSCGWRRGCVLVKVARKCADIEIADKNGEVGSNLALRQHRPNRRDREEHSRLCRPRATMR